MNGRGLSDKPIMNFCQTTQSYNVFSSSFLIIRDCTLVARWSALVIKVSGIHVATQLNEGYISSRFTTRISA